MGMQGNMYVERAMEELKELLKKNADRPAAELLELLEKEIEQIRRAASSGWY